jgi:tripartite-type tricarboxylate transporter receptor subunit TctC
MSLTLRAGVAGFSMLTLALLPAVPQASAQDYPSKPVTVVVSLAAGTGMDTLARLYSEKLQETFGKPFVIENRPGASMMLAATSVATAPPDGHTLLVSTSAAFAINPALYKTINYDPVKGFAPIALYVKSPFILVVNPDLPVKTVADLIKLAKERPTPLSYSSPGAGLAQHLSTEYMKQRFGLNFTHVPYRSSPQAVSDIVAGHVQFGFAEAGASLPLIREGKLRALAVSSLERLPTLPDVAPFAEAANAPGFEAVSWHMIYAPAGTPQPIVDRLHNEMKRIMALPEIREKIIAIGLLPLTPPSLPDTIAYQNSEREKWGSLVRSLGLEGSQ